MAGNESFQKLTERTLEKFESRERIWDNFAFFGMQITTLSPGRFMISQTPYIQKLQLVPDDVTFEKFQSARAELSWVGNTRPDICCAINRAAQVKRSNLCKTDIDELNDAVKKVKSSQDVGLLYDKLDESSLCIKVYVDASFATNKDYSSQIGYISLLCDGDNNCHVLEYGSRKSRRVVRSIMGGEVIAFSVGYDRSLILRYDTEQIYKHKIPLVMLTDSKQTFDVITKGSSTEERRLLINIAVAREAYEHGLIGHVGLVKSENNIADGLTKTKFCKALDNVIRTGKDNNKVEQWIKRTTPPSRSIGGSVNE